MVKTATPSIAVAVSPRGAGTPLSVSSPSKLISINRGPEGSAGLINISGSAKKMREFTRSQPLIDIHRPIQASITAETKLASVEVAKKAHQSLDSLTKELASCPRKIRRSGSFASVSARNRHIAIVTSERVSADLQHQAVRDFVKTNRSTQEVTLLNEVKNQITKVKASARRSLVRELARFHQVVQELPVRSADRTSAMIEGFVLPVALTEPKPQPMKPAPLIELQPRLVSRVPQLQLETSLAREPGLKPLTLEKGGSIYKNQTVHQAAQLTLAPLIATGLITQQEAAQFTQTVIRGLLSDQPAVEVIADGGQGKIPGQAIGSAFEMFSKRQQSLRVVRDSEAERKTMADTAKAVKETAKRNHKGELEAEGIEIAGYLTATESDPGSFGRLSGLALMHAKRDGYLDEAIDKIRGLKRDRAGLVQARALQIMHKRVAARYGYVGEEVGLVVQQKILKRYYRRISLAIIQALKAVIRQGFQEIKQQEQLAKQPESAPAQRDA